MLRADKLIFLGSYLEKSSGLISINTRFRKVMQKNWIKKIFLPFSVHG